MSKERKEFRYSTHHILPRSRGGDSDKKNLIELKENLHRSIHTLFANQMIAEQLITTVGLSEKALRKDVREWLLETLTSRDINNPYERYVSDIIK